MPTVRLILIFGIIGYSSTDKVQFGLSGDFPCHCQDGNNSCSSTTGYCSTGCESGWYGPGCQSGNIAFGKTAKQSSNAGGTKHTASMALDGRIPNSDTADYCTHTEGSAALAWWYVDLVDLHVIQSVTIVNRNGSSANRLSDFFILVTNESDVSTSQAPPIQQICHYQVGAQDGVNKTYQCSSRLIGSRVIIRFKQRQKDNILTLCEVYVNGYKYKNCTDSSRFGPGCLLYKNGSLVCRNATGSKSGTEGQCLFSVCPQDKFVPPLCWQNNLTFGHSDGFPCHCPSGSSCNALNGFCSSGCETGWSGPGCQIGNIALGKTAMQSRDVSGTEHLASMAVDGQIPNDESAFNCTHTNGSKQPAWWYVDLGDLHTIINISIYDRQGSFADRLRNFSILVTSESMGDPDMKSQKWQTCYTQPSQQVDVNTTYACSSPSVGRRVAIYLHARSDSVVTLCEVYVDGYLYKHCQDNEHFGPGCLLYKNDSSSCLESQNATSGRDGECHFTVCPQDDLMPPLCWKKMPRLDNSNITITSSCDSVTVKIDGWKSDPAVLSPTSFLLEELSNTTIEVKSESSSALDTVFSLLAAPGQMFRLQLRAKACSDGKCYNGPAVQLKPLRAGDRSLRTTIQGDCVYFDVVSTDDTCTQPFRYTTACNAGTSSPSFNRSAVICGLLANTTYNCTVTASLMGNFSFFSDVFIMPQSLKTHKGSTFSCHCQSGKQCFENGFCTNGCASGWSGPGCQIGNVAYRKNVRQSSTFPWNGATSGPERAIDGESSTCSATKKKNGSNSWWYVTLSDTDDYVIQNVTIVTESESLREKLIILVTSGSGDVPDSSTWQTCGSGEPRAVGGRFDYTCSKMTLGKRVAAYLNDSKNTALKLCEVYVYGYIFSNCSDSNYFGPGCLLQNCSSERCVASNSVGCGTEGECLRGICPENKHLPPDCWKPMPNITISNATLKGNCESISVDIGQLIVDGHTLIPKSYVLQSVEIDNANNSREIKTTNFSNLSFVVDAEAGKRYDISVHPEVCINDSNCHKGPTKILGTINSGRRSLLISKDDYCVSFKVVASSDTCPSPSSHQVTCFGDGGLRAAVMSNHTCDLPKRTAQYNCTFVAFISTNINVSVESVFQNIPEVAALSVTDLQSAIGGSVGVVIAVLITSAAVMLWIRHKRLTGSKDGPMELPDRLKGNDVQRCDALLKPSADTEAIYDNVIGMTIHEFEKYVTQEEFIAKKFLELPQQEIYACSVARQLSNKPRNRFQNMFPYDSNRVILRSPGDDNPDGYINASYMNGYARPRHYIATQGPSSKTIDDFWRMVWQEDCPVIVMLTSFIEQGKKKCEEYFPLRSSASTVISVSVKSATQFDSYQVTELQLFKDGHVKSTFHCHFTSWPDHSVPEHLSHVIIFRSKVNSLATLSEKKRGPIIVHCSAGIGRTGAYISIDNLLDRFKAEGRVDVDSCVMRMREERMLLVQTKVQYLFVHQAVLHGMKTEKFILSNAEIPSFCDRMVLSSSCADFLDEEWQVLQGCTKAHKPNHFEAALQTENTMKNHKNHVLPGDARRPLLYSGGTEVYINAVYCNGCYSANSFLATQLPLPETVCDFWKLVYDKEASCIVLLHNIPSDKSCPQFWQSSDCADTPATFGTFEVTTTAVDNSNALFSVHNMKIQLKQDDVECERIVLIFVLKIWPEGAQMPSTPHGLLEFARTMRSWRSDHSDQPIIIQCLDGATCSGLLIAAINALDRLQEDKVLQLFHTVELLRTRHECFVSSKAQYAFLYECLLLQYKNDKANDLSCIYENSPIYDNC